MSRAVPANATTRPEHARPRRPALLAPRRDPRRAVDAERGARCSRRPDRRSPPCRRRRVPVRLAGRLRRRRRRTPLLCLSDLAEHSRNLAADPRASLMASETGPGRPARTRPGHRARHVVELRDDLRVAALHAYRERHPDAFYAAFGDFRLYRLDVSSVRYVGGFGQMSWVSADDHAAAEPDPLRPHVAGIVGHMNDDHADALVAYCRVFGRRPATERAEMVGVDRYGFTMLARTRARRTGRPSGSRWAVCGHGRRGPRGDDRVVSSGKEARYIIASRSTAETVAIRVAMPRISATPMPSRPAMNSQSAGTLGGVLRRSTA